LYGCSRASFVRITNQTKTKNQKGHARGALTPAGVAAAICVVFLHKAEMLMCWYNCGRAESNLQRLQG
jgi:hypothetical protein